jgi:hypothetical protein
MGSATGRRSGVAAPRATPTEVAAPARPDDALESEQQVASSLVSSLGFGRAKPEAEANAGTMTDEEYVAWGKASNQTEQGDAEAAALFRLLDDDEGLDGLYEVPFGLKHVKDVHVVMRHSVAVAGERREDLTRHSLFHPAFAAFALGFSIGLVQAHRVKHMGFRASLNRMSRRQVDLCNGWGVEIATYYLAVVDENGIFGKEADMELYGIADLWRNVSDERRLEPFDRLQECVEAGKKAAHIWFDDDSADVPPYFLDSLANFVDAYPSRAFE